MDGSGIPRGVTLANWDLGGEPSAWAYLHAGELLPFYRFEACLGWRPAWTNPLPSPYEYVAALPSHRRPGEAYEYLSVNTFVLSWLIERVTGLPFAEVLGREIWSQARFEAPARLCGSAAGAPGSHGGLSTTLRDLARFGMLFTPSSRRPTIRLRGCRPHSGQVAGRPDLGTLRGRELAASACASRGPHPRHIKTSAQPVALTVSVCRGLPGRIRAPSLMRLRATRLVSR
jgi:CubicO group peptidase (beta-lactamase class C family)